MKLVCVIASLGCGGAERVLSTLVNAWARERPVAVVTFDHGDTAPFFALDPRVVHTPISLDKTSRWFGEGAINNLGRIRRLRAELRRQAPDLIVSFGDRTNILTLFASRTLDVPVVISERVDPRLYSPGAVWSALRRAVYPLAATVVVQTERTREYLRSRLKAPLVVIPNPISEPDGATSDDDVRDAVIVAIGRLQPQKGFDVLLRGFSRMSSRFSNWRLLIVGDGPLRQLLEDTARSLTVSDRVSFPGLVPETGSILRRAGIFASTSRFEGFPNALAEAMAHGCAVVATDCPTGPAELIDDGVSGLLVPVDDVDALGAALDRLAGDPGLRRRLGSAAAQAVAPYRPDRIVQQWNRLLENVAVAHTQREA